MYKKQTHIHFIGIGGIGMSGIATILKSQGYYVSGCDNDLEQKSIQDLIAHGCRIHEGNNTPSCHDNSIDIVVYSSAIHKKSPELEAARARNIPVIPRAVMLAEIMRTKFSIAIAGAHGKTTTTSLISHLLIETQKDPTVIIGGHLTNISTNARLGRGDFLVAEADESDKSLVRIYPTIAVVTNIDLEHVDVYKDLDDIKQTFKIFLENLPFYGKAILCDDNQHLSELTPLSCARTYWYGFKNTSDIYAQDIVLEADYSTCTVWRKDSKKPLGALLIPIPGRHNVLNTLAAISVCLDLDIPFASLSHALSSFTGIDRRFTFKGTYKGASVFDDYGHHPTEIEQTIAVARKKTQGKLIVAFQPHRYSRTQGLWNDFIDLFSEKHIDTLIITDIYAASEAPIDGITSQKFVTELKKKSPNTRIIYAPLDQSFNELRKEIDNCIEPGDLLLLQGAGKINKLAQYLQINNS